ncbi:MAG: DUF3471 domain-containing protein [Gemmatimonadaceae bacterium]
MEPRDHSAEALAGVRSRRAREETGRQWLAEQIATRREPAHPLTAYVGVYEASLYGPIRVWLEQGRLAMQMARGPIADLTPHGGDSLFVLWRDRFFGETLAAHVTFVAGLGGRIASLRMPIARDTVTASRSGSIK